MSTRTAVIETADDLTRARQAHQAHDWATAAAHFDAVGAAGLTADDLTAHADALWWLGRVEDNLRVEAAAHDALLAESRTAEAAWAAIMLGIFHMGRGDVPQAMGWTGRAARLLEGAPESPAHGLLIQVSEVEPALQAGQPAVALEAARRMQALGVRIDEPGLALLGVSCEGRALIRAGQVLDGLALLDEAMVAALDGRLEPFTTGTLYCHTIAACHDVADLSRMIRWTDLAEDWLSTLPAVGVFGGLCAVHRAQLHLLQGAWEEAERAALRVVGDLGAMRVDYTAEAWYVVGEARRLLGDPTAAQAYDEAHTRGRDPQPGRALLEAQHGDAAGAATSIRTAVAAVGPDPLGRAPLWASAVEIALAAGQLEDARSAAAELADIAATYGTSGLAAMAATARGAVLLADDRAEEALPLLRDAYRRWHELGAAYDAAGTCALLAGAYRSLGDDTSAAVEAAHAEAAYLRLRARRPTAPPDGLSRRECEVLALVAAGRSNREIGEVLFISDRTVARHLTNIFHKIGVTSRTQAVRYAVDHELTVTR